MKCQIKNLHNKNEQQLLKLLYLRELPTIKYKRNIMQTTTELEYNFQVGIIQKELILSYNNYEDCMPLRTKLEVDAKPV